MITSDDVPVFYDWLSRYVQVSNWLAYRDRFAAFTMHKRLAVNGDAKRTAGVEHVNDVALNAVRLPPEPRVLDAGCGFGGTTFRWHERAGGQYDGVTLSRVQVTVATREARRRGIDGACRFHLRSYDAPFPPVFDAVVAIESLIHSPNLEATVANLARALRPTGVMAVVDDMSVADVDRSHPAETALLRSHWGITQYPTHSAFRSAFASAGLDVVRDDDLSLLMRPRPAAVLDRLERRYLAIHRAVPLRPARTVVSAFLGGIALERLHASGDVQYRLIVGRPRR